MLQLLKMFPIWNLCKIAQVSYFEHFKPYFQTNKQKLHTSFARDTEWPKMVKHYCSIAVQMEHSFLFLKIYMKVILHWELAWA